MRDIFQAQGQCLCGAVTVTVKGPPVRMAQCHCVHCQRITGTGHSTNAFFNAADVEVKGETRGFGITADSGNTLTRNFCVACGSRAFGTSSGRPGIMSIPAGLFEASDWFKPMARYFVSRQRTWDADDASLPCFEGMPPSPGMEKK